MEISEIFNPASYIFDPDNIPQSSRPKIIDLKFSDLIGGVTSRVQDILGTTKSEEKPKGWQGWLNTTMEQEKPSSEQTQSAKTLGSNKKQWAKDMQAIYIQAGATPTFAKYLTAQDALESGWGLKIIGDFNFGNIKTGKSWTGPSRKAHDKREGSYDAYRSYASASDYAADKLRLLKSRYKMTGNESAEEFTDKLVAGGYATGKNYKQSVLNVIKSVN